MCVQHQASAEGTIIGIMIEDHETESNEDEEEERPVFRPYTRESLIQSEARIAEEEAKRNERKKKREEGEVSWINF